MTRQEITEQIRLIRARKESSSTIDILIADFIQSNFVERKPLIAIGEKLGVGGWREAMDDLRPLIGKEYPWPNSF